MFINFEKKRLTKKFSSQRGASMLEVILAIALVLLLIPFMYYQIADMNNAVKDVAVANKIVKLQDRVIDFIRVNQSDFPANGELQEFTTEELEALAPADRRPHSGWVFKNANGFTEIYLAFHFGSDYKTANIAKYIGSDAAIVSDDNAAYARDWAVNFGEDILTPGDLIFKITHNFSDSDSTQFLHRGTIGGSGENKLNRMLADLNMNNNNLFHVRDMVVSDVYGDEKQVDIGTAQAKSLTASNGNAPLKTGKTSFTLGADASNVQANFTDLTVSENIINFGTVTTKYISADTLDVFNAMIQTSLNVKNLKIGEVTNNSIQAYTSTADYNNLPEINLNTITITDMLTAGYVVQSNAITSREGKLIIGNVCHDGVWCEAFKAGPAYYLFYGGSGNRLPMIILIGYQYSAYKFRVKGIDVAEVLTKLSWSNDAL